MSQRVYVVTGFELGWDNVVGVFDAGTVSREELKEQFPDADYYIDERVLQTRIDND